MWEERRRLPPRGGLGPSRRPREERASRPQVSNQQIELYGLALRTEATGDTAGALELLARGIERWPDSTQFTEMRDQILEG